MGKKLLRFVDKISQSKYFQQATEYKWLKKAMEEVSNTQLVLNVELCSITGTLAVNIPPPPSDRLWLVMLQCKVLQNYQSLSLTLVFDVVVLPQCIEKFQSSFNRKVVCLISTKNVLLLFISSSASRDFIVSYK